MHRFALLAIIAAHAAFAQSVTVTNSEIKLPTYPIYASDYNPRFNAIERAIIYPYAMQDDLGDERVDITYQTVVLENEYLKIICLPQIGGRIHSVFDKTSNHEMFHRNDVIKPGLIALRGAWISGGIEWNRGPQGHTVTSFSPVNVTSQTNADGSASIVVGYTELNFRTRWNVVLTLRPGKAYLDESIRIYNPTDGQHSYYFWNNTAFPCKPGTRFMYPMKLGQDHAGTNFFTWPINKGKDITWLKNYDEPSSVFAYQCAFDFFGAYDVDDDRGIVQYGDHRMITGKKAWTWGQSGDGIASQRALHDDGSQYIEVQSGPLQTQADYGLLGPRQEVAWQEWWYPVHGLGDGFEYATKDIAIQTRWPDDTPGTLEVRMISTGNFPGAVCRVARADAAANPDPGSSIVEKLDLTPATAHSVRVSARKGDRMTIEVSAADGQILASYVTPLDIPDRTAPKPAEKTDKPLTVQERYLEGVKHEQRIEPAAAIEAYEKAVAADAGYTDALVALARIDVGRARYAEAANRALSATQRDPDCGLAWYFLGLAAMQLPADARPVDPMTCAYKAVNSLEYAALGHDLAGRIDMRNKHYADAITEFRNAAALNPTDTRARDNLVTALYANGQRDAANQEALRIFHDDPLDFIPRAIIALQREPDLYDFVKFMQKTAGRYEFEMIDLAFHFADLGLYADAHTLLAAAYDDEVPNFTGVLYHGTFTDLRARPQPWYVLAWLAHSIGNETKAAEYLAKGKSIPPDYAFPFEPEYIDVLDYAIAQDANDANAHLMRGNLYASFADLNTAVASWEKAAALPNPPSVALRNLAVHAWKKENDLPKASALFAKAIAARPTDQPLYRDAASVLVAQNKRPDAITLLETMPLDHPRRGDITVALAVAYNDEKRYDDTLKLLEETKLSNWELNTESWHAFHKAHVERGKVRLDAKQYDAALEDFSASLTYPEQLGVGRAARAEESEGLYWKGKALDALNRKDEARAAWTEGATGADKSDTQKEYIALCKKALGQ